MKIAYLILAHNTPRHLQRLVSALSTESAVFFIHIDKKTSIREYSEIRGHNVRLIEQRIPVYWGDFSVVEATLVLIRAALSEQQQFDRLVLLSGADYPVKSARFIEQYFFSHPEREFIQLAEMPADHTGKPISRLTTFQTRARDAVVVQLLQKFLVRRALAPGKRDYKAVLGGLDPYGGSGWWALTRQACEYILAFVRNEPRMVDFFKNTVIPDETFFHTILGNSEFKERVAHCVTFADWSAGGKHPATIEHRHLAIINKEASRSEHKVLFARKFTDESTTVIEMLREQTDNGQSEA